MTRPSRNQGETKMATTKKQTEITQASVARGVDKQTHEVFYVVKSDSSETTWYTVRWNNERLQWCCNCPARCDGCKHQRATLEVLKIRRQRIALAMGGEMPKIVAKLQAEEDAKLAARERPTSQKGNLNGGGREFSLLR